MFIPAKRNVGWGLKSRGGRSGSGGGCGIMVAWLTAGLVAVVGARMAGRGD